MIDEAIKLLRYLVEHDGGSISGYSFNVVTWLQGQAYIETWRAGHWTITEKGLQALPARVNCALREQVAQVIDNRPRRPYRLPDGSVVQIMFDHGDAEMPTITYQLIDRSIVIATRVSFVEDEP